MDVTTLCTYCRSRHLLTFSAPAIPLLSDPPPPGPGHYELVDYNDPTKYESSGAVFVSTTGRWNSNKLAVQHDLPGPGTLICLHHTSWIISPQHNRLASYVIHLFT